LQSWRPDAVFILAGTNDLWRCDSSAITTSLTRQYEACANAGVQHVVGLTLPPFTADATRWFSFVDLPRRIEQTRLTVNEDIRRAAPVLLDLAAEADADTTYARPDGIHFTREGYRALGLRVAETLEAALLGRAAPPRTAIYPGQPR